MMPLKLFSPYLPLTLAFCANTLAQEEGQTPQWPLQTFKTTAHQAPYLNVTKSGATEPGYLFFATTEHARNGTTTAYIWTDDGQIIWYDQTAKYYSSRHQVLNGEPVITSWHGAPLGGYGYGTVSILNSSYDEIAEVILPNDPEYPFNTGNGEEFPSYIDSHEDEITADGTMLVTAVNITQTDLSTVGGPKGGWIHDGLFYEVDIETKEVLFRWSALEHLDDLPLSDAEIPLGEDGGDMSKPWGFAHFNSLVKYGDTYLVSSRHTCSVLLIGKDGNIIWKLHVSHPCVQSHSQSHTSQLTINSRAKKAATSPSHPAPNSATNTPHASSTKPPTK